MTGSLSLDWSKNQPRPNYYQYTNPNKRSVPTLWSKVFNTENIQFGKLKLTGAPKGFQLSTPSLAFIQMCVFSFAGLLSIIALVGVNNISALSQFITIIFIYVYMCFVVSTLHVLRTPGDCVQYTTQYIQFYSDVKRHISLGAVTTASMGPYFPTPEPPPNYSSNKGTRRNTMQLENKVERR